VQKLCWLSKIKSFVWENTLFGPLRQQLLNNSWLVIIHLRVFRVTDSVLIYINVNKLLLRKITKKSKCFLYDTKGKPKFVFKICPFLIILYFIVYCYIFSKMFCTDLYKLCSGLLQKKTSVHSLYFNANGVVLSSPKFLSNDLFLQLKQQWATPCYSRMRQTMCDKEKAKAAFCHMSVSWAKWQYKRRRT